MRLQSRLYAACLVLIYGKAPGWPMSPPPCLPGQLCVLCRGLMQWGRSEVWAEGRLLTSIPGMSSAHTRCSVPDPLWGIKHDILQ